MLLIGPKNHVTFKKKGLPPKFQRFFRSKSSHLKKKKVVSEISSLYPAEIKLFACDFDGPLSLLDVIWMGPLKSMGPGVIVPPAPPLGSPASAVMPALHSGVQIFVVHWGGLICNFTPILS